MQKRVLTDIGKVKFVGGTFLISPGHRGSATNNYLKLNHTWL